jgi:hypothetical protein
MLFLARWARRLSWKETAEAFRTSWEKVFDAVEHVVTYGKGWSKTMLRTFALPLVFLLPKSLLSI